MPMDDWNWDVAANAVDADDYVLGDQDNGVEVIPLQGLGAVGHRKRLPFEPTGKSTYIGLKDEARRGVIPLSHKQCEEWVAQYRADPEAARDFPLVSADVNGTLGVFTYGQSRLSCRGSASRWCRDNCYAGMIREVEGEEVLIGAGQFVYDTTVIPAHFRWCLSLQPDFTEIMIEHLRSRPRVRVLRVFSEGDFSSPQNVKDWGRVAASFPDRQFTFYTRKWVLGGVWTPLLVALAKMANVTIELSWDPSMPVPPMSILKYTGLSVSGVAPSAGDWLERLSAVAQKAGGRLVFCPKNLSTVCSDEAYEGISCAECKWCYGVEKRPMVFYLLHGLHFRNRDPNNPLYKGMAEGGGSANILEAIERADWTLGQKMLRAGMVPPKYSFHGGTCAIRSFEQAAEASADVQREAARRVEAGLHTGKWAMKNATAAVLRERAAKGLALRKARGLVDDE